MAPPSFGEGAALPVFLIWIKLKMSSKLYVNPSLLESGFENLEQSVESQLDRMYSLKPASDKNPLSNQYQVSRSRENNLPPPFARERSDSRTTKMNCKVSCSDSLASSSTVIQDGSQPLIVKKIDSISRKLRSLDERVNKLFAENTAQEESRKYSHLVSMKAIEGSKCDKSDLNALKSQVEGLSKKLAMTEATVAQEREKRDELSQSYSDVNLTADIVLQKTKGYIGRLSQEAMSSFRDEHRVFTEQCLNQQTLTLEDVSILSSKQNVLEKNVIELQSVVGTLRRRDPHELYKTEINMALEAVGRRINEALLNGSLNNAKDNSSSAHFANQKIEERMTELSLQCETVFKESERSIQILSQRLNMSDYSVDDMKNAWKILEAQSHQALTQATQADALAQRALNIAESCNQGLVNFFKKGQSIQEEADVFRSKIELIVANTAQRTDEMYSFLKDQQDTIDLMSVDFDRFHNILYELEKKIDGLAPSVNSGSDVSDIGDRVSTCVEKLNFVLKRLDFLESKCEVSSQSNSNKESDQRRDILRHQESDLINFINDIIDRRRDATEKLFKEEIGAMQSHLHPISSAPTETEDRLVRLETQMLEQQRVIDSLSSSYIAQRSSNSIICQEADKSTEARNNRQFPLSVSFPSVPSDKVGDL